MNLNHWEIAYDPDTEPSNGADLEIVTNDSQHAAIRINVDRFLAQPPGVQRELIVHEMGHLYTDRLRSLRDDLKRSVWFRTQALKLKKSERVLLAITIDCLSEEFEKAEEYCVQGFARLVAPSLPLPPKLTRASDRRRRG